MKLQPTKPKAAIAGAVLIIICAVGAYLFVLHRPQTSTQESTVVLATPKPSVSPVAVTASPSASASPASSATPAASPTPTPVVMKVSEIGVQFTPASDIMDLAYVPYSSVTYGPGSSVETDTHAVEVANFSSKSLAAAGGATCVAGNYTVPAPLGGLFVTTVAPEQQIPTVEFGTTTTYIGRIGGGYLYLAASKAACDRAGGAGVAIENAQRASLISALKASATAMTAVTPAPSPAATGMTSAQIYQESTAQLGIDTGKLAYFRIYGQNRIQYLMTNQAGKFAYKEGSTWRIVGDYFAPKDGSGHWLQATSRVNCTDLAPVAEQYRQPCYASGGLDGGDLYADVLGGSTNYPLSEMVQYPLH